MNKTALIAGVLTLLLRATFALGVDAASLCADRAAIERVYHGHRTGTKPPFEQAMPPALLEKLVREDAKKEAVLARTYGVKITDTMLAAEVQRIATTTRAPEMLAEIKAALGGDPARFARTMARPIVVERALRARFENDDKLHAPQRRSADAMRAAMLATDGSAFAQRLSVLQKCRDGEVQEQVWTLTPRPAADIPPVPAPAAQPTSATARGGIYTNEATAQIAQVLSSPEHGADAKRTFYFEDLDAQMQKILRAQLRASGDVSAVLETPVGFLLFLAKEKTDASLSAAILTIRKRSYESWLAEQPEQQTP